MATDDGPARPLEPGRDYSAKDLERFRNRLERLRTEASSWRYHWRELGDHLLPRRPRIDQRDRGYGRGTKKHQKILNNTGTRALRILSSGMMAGLTSPARPWFRLLPAVPAMMRIRAVRVWLASVERRMLDVFARSNIYNALPTVYKDLSAFGTSPMIVENDDKDVLRSRVFPVGSYYLAQDDTDRVNTIYRETTMTAEQMARRWGTGNLSRHATQALTDDPDRPIDVVHLIEPNDKILPGRLDAAGMAYRSVWYEEAATNENKLLHVGGFHEFPVMAPRWEPTGEDVYGTGPGMDALPDIKGLQHLERRKLQALDKIVNPAMVGPSELRQSRVSLIPGDVTYLPRNVAAGAKFEPAHTVDLRAMGDARAEVEAHEYRINSTFMADLFLMMASSAVPNMTAREVQERHEEKILQLGPVLERLEDELLGPLIDRAFGILLRGGLLDEPPEEMLGHELRVEYISILAQAQKLVSTYAVERMITFIGSMAEIDPESLDKLDADATVDLYADMLGVPPTMLRSSADIAARRSARAQQQQQEQMMAAAQTAQAGAGAARDLSQAQAGGESALDNLRRLYSRESAVA